MMKTNWNLKDKDELLEFAWGIIANANEGNWDKATKEWKRAAETWRDRYFAGKRGKQGNNSK